MIDVLGTHTFDLRCSVCVQVAMQDLTCTGGELSYEECSWTAPSEECLSHSMDSVVYCGMAGAGIADGALRLLASDGSRRPQLVI